MGTPHSWARATCSIISSYKHSNSFFRSFVYCYMYYGFMYFKIASNKIKIYINVTRLIPIIGLSTSCFVCERVLILFLSKKKSNNAKLQWNFYVHIKCDFFLVFLLSNWKSIARIAYPWENKIKLLNIHGKYAICANKMQLRIHSFRQARADSILYPCACYDFYFIIRLLQIEMEFYFIFMKLAFRK